MTQYKFCSVTPIYNEFGEHLRRNLEQQEKLGIEKAYFPDGCWHPIMDSKARKDGLSYDGTRELISEFKFAELLNTGWYGEIKTLNTTFKKAAMDGYDFVLQLAADEYLTGDMERFKQNAIDSLDEGKNMFWMKFITHHISPPSQKFDKLARLIYNPMFVRVRHIHWWYYVADKPVDYGSLVRGLELHHDDKPRDRKREAAMLRFQKLQTDEDAKKLEVLNKINVPDPIITKHECGCEEGVKFRLDKGTIIGNNHRVRCAQHITLNRNPSIMGRDNKKYVYLTRGMKNKYGLTPIEYLKVFHNRESAKLYAKANKITYQKVALL